MAKSAVPISCLNLAFVPLSCFLTGFCRWVPFDIAGPLLDRKKYVVLSDFTSSRNGEPLPPTILQNHMEEQHGNLFSECKNDMFVHEDEEMIEFDYEDSDDESDPETSSPSAGAEDGDVGNILIGLKSIRLRFKVCTVCFFL